MFDPGYVKDDVKGTGDESGNETSLGSIGWVGFRVAEGLMNPWGRGEGGGEGTGGV